MGQETMNGPEPGKTGLGSDEWKTIWSSIGALLLVGLLGFAIYAFRHESLAPASQTVPRPSATPTAVEGLAVPSATVESPTPTQEVPEAAPTDVPAPSSTPTAIAPRPTRQVAQPRTSTPAELMGTTWNLRAAGESYVIHFQFRGVLNYRGRDGVYRTGTYAQSGRSISMSLGEGRVFLDGVLEDARMGGDGRDASGRRFRWAAEPD
jgi:hypothetical protein